MKSRLHRFLIVIFLTSLIGAVSPTQAWACPGDSKGHDLPRHYSSEPPQGTSHPPVRSFGVVVLGNQVLNGHWCGGKGYFRYMDTGSYLNLNALVTPSTYVTPQNTNALPPATDPDQIQAQSEVILGSSLLQGFWINNVSWYRFLPYNAATATVTNWNIGWSQSGTAATQLPAASNGNIHGQSDVVFAGTYAQVIWRGGVGWQRYLELDANNNVVSGQWSKPFVALPVPQPNPTGTGTAIQDDALIYVNGVMYHFVVQDSALYRRTLGVDTATRTIRWDIASGWTFVKRGCTIPTTNDMCIQ